MVPNFLFCINKVYKTGVTHYFRIDAACRDFGYMPKAKDFSNVVKWFRDRGHGRTNSKREKSGYCLSALMTVLVFCGICFLLFSLLPMVN